MSKQKNDLYGLVMSGGKSERMGSDKGLLRNEGKTWAERAYQKLEIFNIEVSVSINPSQHKDYSKIFPEEKLITDSINVPGPLAGLLSHFSKFPDKDILILASDMQDISLKTIDLLINTYKEKKGEHDFFVYSNERELEPLLGIYSNTGLKEIYQNFLLGTISRYSMKYVLSSGDVFSIPLSVKQKEEFKNYNERKDL